MFRHTFTQIMDITGSNNLLSNSTNTFEENDPFLLDLSKPIKISQNFPRKMFLAELQRSIEEICRRFTQPVLHVAGFALLDF